MVSACLIFFTCVACRVNCSWFCWFGIWFGVLLFGVFVVGCLLFLGFFVVLVWILCADCGLFVDCVVWFNLGFCVCLLWF